MKSLLLNHVLPLLLALIALTSFAYCEETDGTAYNDEAAYADDHKPNVASTGGHDTYRLPEDLKDGLTIASLKDAGADVAKIMEMSKKTAAGDWKQIDSILIAYKGNLVFEDYYHGGKIDEPHTLMSITKSVTACIAGCAVQKGLIKNLNDPVLNYFPSITREEVDPSVMKITVHDVLSSRTGLKEGSREKKPEVSGKGVIAEAKKLYTQSVAEGVGENFAYGGVNAYQTGLLLCAVSGKALNKFAEETLFADLGIEKYKWKKGRGGSKVHSVGAGLELRSRDMMKVGLLIRNKGKCGEKQVLPESYVEAMTGAYHKSPHMGNYGYMWWSTGGPDDKKGQPLRISARGAKGQFIFYRPDLDLVAVFTSNNRKAFKQPFEMFDQFIVPAFTGKQ